MSTIQTENLDLDIMKTRTGAKRGFIQIKATIIFELKRNFKNVLILLGVSLGMFVLSLIIDLIPAARGVEDTDDAASYFQGYLMLIDFLIMIIATTFAGSIIAEDYSKQTGNLVFPKLSKGRLLTGRVIARYLLSAATVIFYYVSVIIATLIKYQELPVEVLLSMAWALLYTFLVLSLVIFFSSFMKSTNNTVIVSILMILIVFNLTSTILMFTGVEIEPFFILTYYANIITASFSMPETRYAEQTFGGPGGAAADGPSFFSWSTPSVAGAIIGMLVYSVILLTSAYLLFRRRQQKQ